MMASEEFFRQHSRFLPQYLTPAEKKDLWKEIEAFPKHQRLYADPTTIPQPLLQGDGWTGLTAMNFYTGERRTLAGVLISNSCDISLTNKRISAAQLLFAPITTVARYRQLLTDAGSSPTQADGVVQAIKKQRQTTTFFLPGEQHGPDEDCLVRLDDIRPHPLRDFADADRDILFRLNQFGFYLFLIKLSIHFSRLQEGIARG